MPPASSKKNQTNSNNRHKQSHITTPSTSKTPNRHDSTESNEEKKYVYKNQTTRTERRITESQWQFEAYL